MLFQVIGDQAIYFGLFRHLCVTQVRLVVFTVRKSMVRHHLNQKIPPRRLNITGEDYVC